MKKKNDYKNKNLTARKKKKMKYKKKDIKMEKEKEYVDDGVDEEEKEIYKLEEE